MRKMPATLPPISLSVAEIDRDNIQRGCTFRRFRRVRRTFQGPTRFFKDTRTQRQPPENPDLAWVLVIALLLLTLAAIAAGYVVEEPPGSGKPARRPRPSQPRPEQPQLASSATNAGANPTSTQSPKAPLQQLVTGIWHVSSPDSSTVIIDLQGEVQYEAHRLADPERIYFDLHGTQLSPGLFGKTIEVGDSLLARVRIAQPRKGSEPGGA